MRATTNSAGAPGWRHAVDQLIGATLMIPLPVVMRDELAQSPPAVALSRNHPVQAFALDRSYEPLRRERSATASGAMSTSSSR